MLTFSCFFFLILSFNFFLVSTEQHRSVPSCSSPTVLSQRPTVLGYTLISSCFTRLFTHNLTQNNLSYTVFHQLNSNRLCTLDSTKFDLVRQTRYVSLASEKKNTRPSYFIISSLWKEGCTQRYLYIILFLVAHKKTTKVLGMQVVGEKVLTGRWSMKLECMLSSSNSTLAGLGKNTRFYNQLPGVKWIEKYLPAGRIILTPLLDVDCKCGKKKVASGTPARLICPYGWEKEGGRRGIRVPQKLHNLYFLSFFSFFLSYFGSCCWTFSFSVSLHWLCRYVAP